MRNCLRVKLTTTTPGLLISRNLIARQSVSSASWYHYCFHIATVCNGAFLMLPWWRRQMKYFPRYWPFLPGIRRPPVNSPHKGQWRGALMFSLICAWTNGWVNIRDAGDLRRHRPHYEVTVMPSTGMAVYGAHFGAGSGKIWLDEVKCSSTEERLEHCRHAGWGNEDCSHQQDAGVRCSWAHIVIEIKPNRLSIVR